MTEAESTSVIEELAAPEQMDMGGAQAEAETTETTEVVQETDQDRNFRQLRESNEQLRRDREQDRQMMMAMQNEMLKRSEAPAPAPVQEPDEFADVDGSDWISFEQNQKLLARNEKRQDEKNQAAIKKAIEDDRKAQHQANAPQRVKARYQDFDSVVTTENVKQLKALEPDVAQALGLIGDEEAKAVAAYKYIKAFVTGVQETTASKERIQQNASQPKSLSSAAGASPLSQAGAFEKGLTPDLKKHLLAEMNACAKRS